MMKLLTNFLKNIGVMPNGGKTFNTFCLFNCNLYSNNFFKLYNPHKDFYNINKTNWRLKRNDKTNVNRCNSFRTDQSCPTRK